VGQIGALPPEPVQALSISPFRDRIAASVEPIKNIMLALLFLSVGLSIDPEIVASAWAPLLLNTLVIPVVKFGIICCWQLQEGFSARKRSSCRSLWRGAENSALSYLP
jgi:Kef-type K+ transport system membrane component KefB